jgi:hypothetical protein
MGTERVRGRGSAKYTVPRAVRSSGSRPARSPRPGLNIALPPDAASFELSQGAREVVPARELIYSLRRNSEKLRDLGDAHELLSRHATDGTC